MDTGDGWVSQECLVNDTMKRSNEHIIPGLHGFLSKYG